MMAAELMPRLPRLCRSAAEMIARDILIGHDGGEGALQQRRDAGSRLPGSRPSPMMMS